MNLPDPIESARPTRSGVSLGAKVLIALLALVLVVGIVGTIVTVPYVIFSPGDATAVDDVLTIRGTRSYKHRGDILLLTVRVSTERPNIWRFVEASWDDDSKVYGEKQIYGDVSRRQVERASVAMMEESQRTAKQAALTRLGFEVTVSGQGALVQRVVKGSPAQEAGMQAGDVILKIGTVSIQLADELGPAVRSQPPGTTSTVIVRRGDETRSLEVTSEAAPSGDAKGLPYYGIQISTDRLRVKFPVDIAVDPGDVSGPSGGLAFALTIIDDLTPGDLTGGINVAVTGEIDGAGNVGEVGGIPQKAVAARDAGARLMIVPKAEVREARARAGNLKVVGVATLNDALDVLRRNGGTPIAKSAA